MYSGFRNSSQKRDRFIGHQHLSLRFIDDSDEDNYEKDSSNSSNSLIYPKKLSQLGGGATSLKKIRFTDRTAPDYENRITVGEECRKRMLDVVVQMEGKKRREGQDSKLR